MQEAVCPEAWTVPNSTHRRAALICKLTIRVLPFGAAPELMPDVNYADARITVRSCDIFRLSGL